MNKIFGEKLNHAKYHHRPGAYLIAIHQGHIAVVRTPKGIFLPGGGLDEGESHESCIMRECKEEIGHSVSIGEYIGTAEEYKVHYEFGNFHPIQHYYLGRIGKKEINPIEPDHILEWLEVTAVLEEMYLPTQKWGIKEALKKIDTLI